MGSVIYDKLGGVLESGIIWELEESANVDAAINQGARLRELDRLREERDTP